MTHARRSERKIAPLQQEYTHQLDVLYKAVDTMGIRLMRLATLWLVASAEAFRVHGAAAYTAKGVQGGGSSSGATAAGHKRGRPSKQIKETSGGGAGNGVCEAGDSPETCRALAQKYRGGGEICYSCCQPYCSCEDVRMPHEVLLKMSANSQQYHSCVRREASCW